MAVGFLFLIAEGIGFGQLRQQAEEESARRDHAASVLPRRHPRRPLDPSRERSLPSTGEDGPDPIFTADGSRRV